MRKEAVDCLDGLGAVAQVEGGGAALRYNRPGFESVESNSNGKRPLGNSFCQLQENGW